MLIQLLKSSQTRCFKKLSKPDGIEEHIDKQQQYTCTDFNPESAIKALFFVT